MTHDRILLGVLLMLGFCLTAPFIDVGSKAAAATIPVGEITLARFIVQGAIMLPVLLVMGQSLRIPRASLGRLILRAIYLIVSTYCFVAAVQVMPIADALAIAFVEPFILLFLGKFMFGDEVGPRRIAASAVGFVGSLLVIQPSFVAFGPVALFPLGTALFFALYILITRRLSRELHPVAMQFHTSTLAAAMCLPFIVIADFTHWPTLDPVMPQGIEWMWLGMVGAASALAHLLMTYALRFAPSTTLAPLHYLELISAAILGYLFFSDFPNLLTWAGIAIIALSGIYIVHRERITARRGSVVMPQVSPPRSPS